MAALLAMNVVACAAQADGPPAIVIDRTACSHCGMLVSELRYAAAYRKADGTPRVFDDIGCLRKAALQEPASGELRIWFHDASGGMWIDGAEAVLVGSPEIHSPMGGGFIAFRDRAAAADAARQYRGRIVTITELLSKETGS